ncbi:hypothetical protein EV44_g4040 [Erysiphe necator]|uniref:Uncharacterized protein n=1 Tax=Uncinula necator TaxID=52586 RepID=A0A0B1P223_UNCNE|nr:hypothetical protein EV44_g4040 [Erysiphe necator]
MNSETSTLGCQNIVFDYHNLDCYGNPLLCIHDVMPIIETFTPINTDDISCSKLATFPTNRRPKVRTLSNDPNAVIEKWFSECGAIIGPLCSTENQFAVARLLYTYKDLNTTELSEMPATDLYTHKINLKEGTILYNSRSQKRWPRDKEWWLSKMIQDGLDCGMYEPTTARGGGLSPWNAAVKLVPKSDSDQWGDEPRITFTFSKLPLTH